MSNTIIPETLADVLTKADPNKLADALRQVNLGALLTPIKKTITLAAFGVDFPLVPPALIVKTFRVTDNTGGNAAVAPRYITDAGGTPAATIATLADDGSKITVEGTGALVAVVEYIPRSAVDPTTLFKRS